MVNLIGMPTGIPKENQVTTLVKQFSAFHATLQLITVVT
jgi:hypothetical protein